MNNVGSLQKPQNIKDQKQIYETIKQDIMSLAHIKNKFNDAIRKNHLKNPVLFIKGEKSYFSKKNNIRNNALIIVHSKKKSSSLINLEKKINKRFHNFYFRGEEFYNIKIINEIISNENSHIVAEFKDFLIKDDYSEFIQRFYSKEDSIFLLKQIFEYYRLSSVVYPNYILLSENKYIYRNIQKKQKIIDDQQEQEEKNNYKKIKNLDLTENNKEVDKSERVFDSKVIDSILNQSNTSQIQKFVFGVSTETSFDIEDNNNIFNLVKNINKAEETCYSKYIEKNRLINNNSKSNNKNNNDFNNNNNNNIHKNNLKEEKNLLNNQIKRNINKVKQLMNINNNIHGNKIKTRNINNFTEISNFTKTQSNLVSNINKERNLYSLYIDKNPLNQTSKINKINKNKTSINTNGMNDKSINITCENIRDIFKLSKNKKVHHNKNMKSNMLDSKVNNEYLKTLDNNFISIENNSISSRNLKINKKKIDKLGNSKKDFKLKMAPTNLELSKEKINKNLIKKTLINELLSSLGTSFKETWKNSKLTEGELSKSIKKLNRERKIIKTLNLNENNLNNKKKLNNTRNVIDIKGDSYKYLNSKTINNDRNKQMSLDIELISNNNLINNSQLNSNNLENQYSKDSNFNINSITERNIVTTCKREENFRNISKQFVNSNNLNLKDKKSKDKDIRKEFKYNPIFNKIKSRNKMESIINESQNTNSIIKQNSHRNNINNKNSSTKNSNNYCSNDLTYTMINMKKYINNNSIDKNSFKTISNNNRINQHETISDIPTSLKNKLRLNFDFLKKAQINQVEKNNKNIKSNGNFLLTSKNSQNIRRELNKNNHNHNNSIFINKIQRLNKLPLSERMHKVNTNRSCNNKSKKNIDKMHQYNGVFKNSEKSKNNGLKTLINEINIENLMFGYSNSYKNKNKFIKKIKYSNNDNQNLILSNIINKKDEEINKKINYNTISQVDSRQNKRKKISSHIYSNSNCLKNDIISLLNNDYNCFDNNSNSKRKNNNIDNINDYINNNKEKNINNNDSINSPNKLNKIQKNIKTNKNNNSKEKFILPSKNINNKNERYYNIELNINDNINKSNNSKDIFSINKINTDFKKQHIKLNSTTQFSTGNLNINFNNYTNNYCFNYNNNSVLTANQNNTKIAKLEPKNYKRIKTIKNNIKGFQINGFDKIVKNRKNSFFPLTLTDRNKQIKMYLPK